MEWLEIIQLRTDMDHKRLLESELGRLMTEVGGDSGKKQVVRVYRGLIDTDYCVHIKNDSGDAETLGSILGVRLVAALKEFCLVNHRVWVKMEPT
jgi:hypothetical protein